MLGCIEKIGTNHSKTWDFFFQNWDLQIYDKMRKSINLKTWVILLKNGVYMKKMGCTIEKWGCVLQKLG